MLFIRNGRILDPYTNINTAMDILIGDDGRIRELGPALDAPAR